MAICVVVLMVLILLLRDNTEAIDFKMYKTLLETNSIKKAVIDADEVVLWTVDAKYSIIKDGVDVNELLKQVPVQSVKENPILRDLIVIGLFFLMIFGLIFYGLMRMLDLLGTL